MKMIKSLALGAAAGLVAVAGANAADLPVKAKPVAYVKICPTYGPGFYYIPGTDICLKVGGLLLAEVGYNARSATPFSSFGVNGYDGTDNLSNWRTRAYVALDARQNTAYGTLRTFLYGGWEFSSGNTGNGGSAITAIDGQGSQGFMQFAFVQFAGFTAGMATSFFDLSPSYMTLGVAANPWGWNNLIAYTAQLGNGVSATISIEDPTNTNSNKTVLGVLDNGGYEAPDVVGNFRIDQAWGSAQIMAAAKQNRFGSLFVDEEWGYAVGAGIEVKLPMLAPGDSIRFTAVYSEGAIEYTGISQNPFLSGGTFGYNPGVNIGNVTVVDANRNAAGAITLTEGSSISAQFRHFWTPALRSNFHAGYNDAYNRSAGSFGSLQFVQYGHSLVWSPVAGLNLALDVLYSEADTNNNTSDIWSTWFRITRPF